MDDREEATGAAAPAPRAPEMPRFMNVRQVAQYLQINEKKVYALVNENLIPATRLTGKWLFPRDLVDQWILESSHGGVLTDRLVIAGSDDPLLQRAVTLMGAELQGRALVSYAAVGTQLGLSVLARRRADACAIHWGPEAESLQRHPALLRQHVQYRDWILVRICRREQGLMLAPGLHEGDRDVVRLFSPDVRWVARQEGAGSQRFLREVIAEHRLDPSNRRTSARAYSERDAASSIATGQADVAPGVRAAASEFGLDFLPLGWEAFDFAMPRGIYFRTLFRTLLDTLRAGECQRLAQVFGGYDFTDLGNVVWAA
jgi:excisionase family DNA binding protein